MKKGFTLMELLAVIVILGIIVLIVFPVFMAMIEEAKKGSFRNTAYGIVKSADYQHIKNVLNGQVVKVGCGIGYEVFKYENGKPEGKELSFKGGRPQSGTIAINTNGDVALAIHNGKWCAVKQYNDEKVTLYEISKEECEQILPSGREDGYMDVKIFGGGIAALTCDGEVKVGEYYDLDSLIKIEGLPKIKKLYEENFVLSENSDVYQLNNEYDEEQNKKIIKPQKLLSNVKEVYLNNGSVFFLLNNGKVMAYGYNGYHQLGLGQDSQLYYDEPVEIPGLTNVKKMSVSSSGIATTALALLEDGTVKVWGVNHGGVSSDYIKNVWGT